MTCQECELLLADDEPGAAVDDHLSICTTCREFALDVRANLEVMHVFASEPMPKVARPRPVRWPYVAAAVAIAAVLILMFAMPKRHQALVVEVATVVPPAVVVESPRVHPAIHRPRKHRAQGGEPQILQVKMLTADPNVVIYWQIESKRGTE